MFTVWLLDWCTHNNFRSYFASNEKSDQKYSKAASTESESVDNGMAEWDLWLRIESDFNYFLSFTGSVLYLIGSIYYIPSLDVLILGTIIFLVGSAFIFVSQGCKVIRTGFAFERDDSVSPAKVTRRFSVENWKRDLNLVFVDVTASIGGMAYFAGSFLFLPEYYEDDTTIWHGAGWFEVGGIFFWASGAALFYRYFLA